MKQISTEGGLIQTKAHRFLQMYGKETVYCLSWLDAEGCQACPASEGVSPQTLLAKSAEKLLVGEGM